MRIEVPHHAERFGAVRIHGIQEVWELDSGMSDDESQDQAFRWQTVRHIPHAALHEIERRMAIIVPCKNEKLKVLDGVLSGIPHDCLIILVSNSARGAVDRYRMEQEVMERFTNLAQRSAVIVHQRDPALAEAFRRAGMPQILDGEGLVRDGKGEGMVVGLTLAELSGMDFAGFIDADNYVPGAVHEYVKAYAAGFHMAGTPYAMVRISWKAKPKIQGNRLFFNRWGRSSQVTNRFLNLLLSEYSGFGTEIVATGNAGEHAVSLDLGKRMRLGAGFSVEPYQYIDLFEQFGGVFESSFPDVMAKGVEVFQIETRNPHFHEDKGSDHVKEMRLQALDVLHHSPICPQAVRDEIAEFLRAQGALGTDELPHAVQTYPRLIDLDFNAFGEALLEKSETFLQTALAVPTLVEMRSPISVVDSGVEPPADSHTE